MTKESKVVDLAHAKMLIEAGIVMETENFIVATAGKFETFMNLDELKKEFTKLYHHPNSFSQYDNDIVYPAPDVMELLERLPYRLPIKGCWYELVIRLFLHYDKISYWVAYELSEDDYIAYESTSLVDTLSEMLVWVEKRGK